MNSVKAAISCIYNQKLAVGSVMACALLALVAGCPTTGGGCDPACEEGFECVNGACEAVAAECDPACDEGVACVNGECEVVAAECDPACDEGVACVNGECEVVAAECDPACDEGVACVNGECEVVAAECDADNPCADDGVFCNGVEACVDGECDSPGSPCTATEECDEEANGCVAVPQEFLDANAVRGGSLYDKWWVVAAVEEPTGEHALYTEEGEKTGSTTWRCKECHGWDYKGADGAYASGSHFTGLEGIFGTTMDAQEVFDSIKTTHGFGAAGLTDDDIWDLAKFVLGEGQFDTDDIIDADNMFTGTAATGQTLYDSGIEGNASCALAACHGPDGQAIDFNGEGEFLGELAVGNPWEFQHKVRFGNPGTAMPSTVQADATIQDVADVGAYAQTLVADAAGGDAVAGEAFYTANSCAVCHGADALGIDALAAPSLLEADGDSIFSNLTGGTHSGPPVADVTQQDADDVAAWLAGL